MAGLEIQRSDRHRPSGQEGPAHAVCVGARAAPRCHGDGPPALHTGGRALGEPAGLQAGSGGRSVHSGILALALGSDGKGLERDRGVRLFLWHGQFLE